MTADIQKTLEFTLQDEGFLRLQEVLKLIPVCKSTWWNGCRTGRFPKPYKLGRRTTAWKVRDIKECLGRFTVEYQ